MRTAWTEKKQNIATTTTHAHALFTALSILDMYWPL